MDEHPLLTRRETVETHLLQAWGQAHLLQSGREPWAEMAPYIGAYGGPARVQALGGWLY